MKGVKGDIIKGGELIINIIIIMAVKMYIKGGLLIHIPKFTIPKAT